MSITKINGIRKKLALTNQEIDYKKRFPSIVHHKVDSLIYPRGIIWEGEDLVFNGIKEFGKEVRATEATVYGWRGKGISLSYQTRIVLVTRGYIHPDDFFWDDVLRQWVTDDVILSESEKEHMFRVFGDYGIYLSESIKEEWFERLKKNMRRKFR